MKKIIIILFLFLFYYFSYSQTPIVTDIKVEEIYKKDITKSDSALIVDSVKSKITIKNIENVKNLYLSFGYVDSLTQKVIPRYINVTYENDEFIFSSPYKGKFSAVDKNTIEIIFPTKDIHVPKDEQEIVVNKINYLSIQIFEKYTYSYTKYFYYMNSEELYNRFIVQPYKNKR
jgi:hypothetical protein